MVLIIGGGIIGLTIAWRLTSIGKKVIIVDKNNLGKEASWAAAGMLSGRLDLRPSEKNYYLFLKKVIVHGLNLLRNLRTSLEKVLAIEKKEQ